MIYYILCVSSALPVIMETFLGQNIFVHEGRVYIFDAYNSDKTKNFGDADTKVHVKQEYTHQLKQMR